MTNSPSFKIVVEILHPSLQALSINTSNTVKE